VILQRYILRELVVAFSFAFSVVMAVSLVGTMFQVFRAFEGLGWTLLLQVGPLAAGYVAPYALLVASATATTLVYGRMSAENEINAMRTSGIPAMRILAPAVLFGLFLAAAGYALHEHATPAARDGRRRILRESILHVLKVPPPGLQRFSLGDYRLSYTDYRNGRLERPTLLRFQPDGKLAFEYHAPEGTILVENGMPVIVMSRPRGVQFDPDGTEHRFDAGSDIRVVLELKDVRPDERRLEDRPRKELEELLQSGALGRRDRVKAETFLHTRRAQSFAPLLLVLVSAPIGIFVRRGSRLAGLGAALPPLLVHFIASFAFQGMGERGRLDPMIAAWAPDAILAALAAVLFSGLLRK